MRDLFDDIFAKGPRDYMETARRAMRPALRRRFYEHVTTLETSAGFGLLLDGKPVRTPGQHELTAPTLALAEAIAAEWRSQREIIEPAQMPLTRLANAILDGVASQPQAVAQEIAQYLGSDLLFYRADGPLALVERQSRHWDPITNWARDHLGARFVLAAGVMFVDQPEEAVAAAREAIPADPWRLGALASITNLTGSALLALALLRGRASVDEAWAAAHVDEDWNMEFWGRDERAMERRALRFEEMQAAATVLQLL